MNAISIQAPAAAQHPEEAKALEAPETPERPDLISYLLQMCVTMGRWKTGREIAELVGSGNCLQSRRAAGLFWKEYVSVGGLGDSKVELQQAMETLQRVWPEGAAGFAGPVPSSGRVQHPDGSEG